VLLTLGKRFWPLLHQHFLSLCNDLQCSVGVRLTMAKSIYQIALIIGSQQATKDLVPPFIEFFKDIDEITIEVVKLLANFIKIVDGSKHESIINQLEICLMRPINIVNWRLREQIALQIIELNKISQKIQKENCVLYLTGLALKLMLDKYDCVRKAGMDAFVSCCEKIKQKKQLLKFIAFHFAGSPRWRERQVYVMTVEKLLMKRAIKPELFNNYVLKKLLELATDKIANIRLCVARCLSNSVMENAYYSSDVRESKKQILQCIKTLEEDVDQDVRDSVYNRNKISVRLPTPPPEKNDVDLNTPERLTTPPPSSIVHMNRRPCDGFEMTREDFVFLAELDLNFGTLSS
jgi:serine/threonine-protein phosphatase 4 regulatory subunit 1